MNTKELIELFNEHVAVPENLTEYVWYDDGRCVGWNGDNNLDDLFQLEGDSYEQEIFGLPVEVGGFILYDLRDGCGGISQAFFDMSKKIDRKELEMTELTQERKDELRQHVESSICRYLDKLGILGEAIDSLYLTDEESGYLDSLVLHIRLEE